MPQTITVGIRSHYPPSLTNGQPVSAPGRRGKSRVIPHHLFKAAITSRPLALIQLHIFRKYSYKRCLPATPTSGSSNTSYRRGAEHTRKHTMTHTTHTHPTHTQGLFKINHRRSGHRFPLGCPPLFTPSSTIPISTCRPDKAYRGYHPVEPNHAPRLGMGVVRYGRLHMACTSGLVACVYVRHDRINDFASSDTTGLDGNSTRFALTITFSRRILSWSL